MSVLEPFRRIALSFNAPGNEIEARVEFHTDNPPHLERRHMEIQRARVLQDQQRYVSRWAAGRAGWTRQYADMPGWNSVRDHVFLITGASTGIGAATARLASEHGYRLVLASRDGRRLQALADELGGPSRALAISCDVTDWQQVKTLADHTAEVFGRLDAAFVNAGLFSGAPLLGDHDTPQEWRQMVLTNVYGAAISAHALWPLLEASHGHLILTGSVAGRVTVPGSLYSATKWAITGLGQSLRAAAAGSHARVTVVHPGLVDAGDIAPDRQNDPKLAPEDVARAVLFALTQPPAVDINEIVIRPAGQDPAR